MATVVTTTEGGHEYVADRTAGFSKRHKFQVGDYVVFSDPRSKTRYAAVIESHDKRRWWGGWDHFYTIQYLRPRHGHKSRKFCVPYYIRKAAPLTFVDETFGLDDYMTEIELDCGAVINELVTKEDVECYLHQEAEFDFLVRVVDVFLPSVEACSNNIIAHVQWRAECFKPSGEAQRLAERFIKP